MVSGTTSENFRSLDENCAHGMHLKFIRHPRYNNNSAFIKGIISDNKLMNLYEIGLFHIV